MIEPIRIDFHVDGPVEHAWTVWTERFGQWWPADHTVTGDAGLTVVLERRLGGRIFERTRDGVEHDWGEVTIWEPTARLGYLWHLRRDRTDATEVEIRFREDGTGTRIEIEHSGWERLGADGEMWRDRNHGGWATLLPWYIAAVEATART